MYQLLLLSLSVYATFACHRTDTEWHLWKTTHEKTYTHEESEMIRYEIWRDNLRRINEHNADATQTFTLGMNHFGDMTNTEFRAYVTKFRKSENKTVGATFLKPSGLHLPDKVDWREQGAVTEVKNQGHCGSCWSFSTTGSVEGQWFKKSGTLVSLSEQQLVDCSSSFGNHGCNGGLMDYAFEYIEKEGLESEADYPYEGVKRTCRYDASKVVAQITGYTDVAEGSEEELQAAVASVGPVSIAIDASHFSFQFYRDGVYNEPKCSPSQLDHGVLAIGYGTWQLSNSPYWLVKNSWGPSWGVAGYIRMSRNKNNQCGVASAASYPLV